MRLLCLLLLLSFSAMAQDRADSLSVFFDFNRAELRSDARSALDEWWSRNGARIGQLRLAGHCDAVGTDTYNDPLSQRRVASVIGYLQAKGLDVSSVQAREGWGERRPVNANSSAEERQRNRRVDLFWNGAPPETAKTAPPPVRVDTFSRTAVEKASEGETLRLQNINFYGGRHTFLPQAMPALKELLQILLERPTLQIEIQGHICCRAGSPLDGDDFDSGDRNLSVNRAHAVYKYLVEGGIDPARMSFRGFAGRNPLVYPEYSEEDRTANRRVEIKIVKK